MHNKVIYVDDDPMLLEIFRELFKDEFEVQIFTSALDALKHLRDCAAADVVITDLSMPEMSGAEFLRLAAHLCPQSIRVVLTGFSTAGEMLGDLTSGLVHHFIAKPWKEEQLREVLERGCLSRMAAHERPLIGKRTEA